MRQFILWWLFSPPLSLRLAPRAFVVHNLSFFGAFRECIVRFSLRLARFGVLGVLGVSFLTGPLTDLRDCIVRRREPRFGSFQLQTLHHTRKAPLLRDCRADNALLDCVLVFSECCLHSLHGAHRFVRRSEMHIVLQIR